MCKVHSVGIMLHQEGAVARSFDLILVIPILQTGEMGRGNT